MRCRRNPLLCKPKTQRVHVCLLEGITHKGGVLRALHSVNDHTTETLHLRMIYDVSQHFDDCFVATAILRMSCCMTASKVVKVSLDKGSGMYQKNPCFLIKETPQGFFGQVWVGGFFLVRMGVSGFLFW
jgi:hypothetical protein